MERMKPEMETINMVQVIVGETPLGTGSGDITASGASEQEKLELANKMPQYLVAIHENAAGCCIDGRPCMHTLGETAPEPGPSVAGGPAVTAYAAAELVGDYFGSKSAATSQGRLEEVATTLVGGGVKLGAHVSKSAIEKTDGEFVDKATGQIETGCGASDKFKDIMNKPSSDKKFVDDTTAALLGDGFNANYTAFVPQKDLQNKVKDYNARDALNSVAGPAQGRNVEVLEGKHDEILVVVNYVEGTTIDRDRLVAETGKQVFVIDMWYIDKLADAMSFGRPDAIEMREKLRHAMVAFQVSTYATLCDGSHRPVILKPQAQEALVPAAV